MRRNLLVIAAAWLGAATLPAAAQIKMDMNKITCQDMLGTTLLTERSSNTG
jgi:hypothetical protein